MENVFVNPEAFEGKFRSKYGLYKIMKYDSKFHKIYLLSAAIPSFIFKNKVELLKRCFSW